MGLYREEEYRTPKFLKPGIRLSLSTGFGKDFCFKQCLNNLARTGDKSWLMFLMTTTGLLSGSVAFLGSRSLINSRAMVIIILFSDSEKLTEERDVSKRT